MVRVNWRDFDTFHSIVTSNKSNNNQILTLN